MKINRRQLRHLIETTIKKVLDTSPAALVISRNIMPANMVKPSVSPVIKKLLQRKKAELAKNYENDPEEFLKKYNEYVQELIDSGKLEQEAEQEAEEEPKKPEVIKTKKKSKKNQKKKSPSGRGTWEYYIKNSRNSQGAAEIKDFWEENQDSNFPFNKPDSTPYSTSYKDYIKWYLHLNKTGIAHYDKTKDPSVFSPFDGGYISGELMQASRQEALRDLTKFKRTKGRGQWLYVEDIVELFTEYNNRTG